MVSVGRERLTLEATHPLFSQAILSLRNEKWAEMGHTWIMVINKLEKCLTRLSKYDTGINE